MLNDYYQNIGMKGFIQRYGIVNAVKRGAFDQRYFGYLAQVFVKFYMAIVQDRKDGLNFIRLYYRSSIVSMMLL
jgi:hypothetical protein